MDDDEMLHRIDRLVDRFTDRYEKVPDEILERRWKRKEDIKDTFGAMLPLLTISLILLIIAVILNIF